MKQATLVRQALRVLGDRLPSGWKQRLISAKGLRGSARVLEITGPDGTKARLVIEAPPSLFPRDMPALKDRLADNADAGLIVARFLDIGYS